MTQTTITRGLQAQTMRDYWTQNPDGTADDAVKYARKANSSLRTKKTALLKQSAYDVKRRMIQDGTMASARRAKTRADNNGGHDPRIAPETLFMREFYQRNPKAKPDAGIRAARAAGHPGTSSLNYAARSWARNHPLSPEETVEIEIDDPIMDDASETDGKVNVKARIDEMISELQRIRKLHATEPLMAPAAFKKLQEDMTTTASSWGSAIANV